MMRLWFMGSFPRMQKVEHWKRNSPLKMVWGEKFYLIRVTMDHTSRPSDPCLWPRKQFFSSWGTWSGCTKSCGGGIQTRSRTCSIEPSNYMDSSRPLTEQQSCNNQVCPGKGITSFLVNNEVSLAKITTIQFAFVWRQVMTNHFVNTLFLLLVQKTGLVGKLNSYTDLMLWLCQPVSRISNIALIMLTRV